MRRETFFAVIASIGSLAVMLVVCELGLRAALFVDAVAVEPLRQPWRFADSSLDDDYWKLAYLFNATEDGTAVGSFDPDLGWAPVTTRENPFGLHTDRPISEQDLASPVLFYGDSFVAGVTDIEDRIPQILDEIIPLRTVLNLGVSGYGVGQIYARFLQTIDEFDSPVVLVGILTDDLDRSVLSFRSGPKPYWRVEGERLVLHRDHVMRDVDAYLDRYPVRIRSYLLRFVLFRVRDYLPPGLFDNWLGYGEIHRQKLEVNAALLAAFKADADERGLPLGFVVFYSGEEMAFTGWRERFLLDELDELGVASFDTKRLLLDYVRDNDLALADLYFDDLGHPNAEGNAIIARALRDWVDAEIIDLPDLQ